MLPFDTAVPNALPQLAAKNSRPAQWMRRGSSAANVMPQANLSKRAVKPNIRGPPLHHPGVTAKQTTQMTSYPLRNRSPTQRCHWKIMPHSTNRLSALATRKISILRPNPSGSFRGCAVHRPSFCGRERFFAACVSW
jgi:hypothetical protein